MHFIERQHKFQNISKNFFHPLFQGKSHFWHNSGAVAPFTQPTKILLNRYAAGFISNNNSRLIFSEVKKLTKILPLFCALVDYNHHAMTVLYEYSGSLACIRIIPAKPGQNIASSLGGDVL